MKKYLVFISMLVAVFVLSSCGNDDELERLKAQNDSLQNVANENQAQIDEFMAAFNDIQQNLNTIKEKEHIIDVNSADTSEMTPDMKAQIESDLSSIYDLMQENEQALAALRQQLKSSGIKNKQLEETLALYEEQMKQKDEEISTLKQRLEEMNFNMEKLNEKIDQMANNLDSMAQVQNQQSQVISEQDRALHTVYYVVGTKDELKSHNIISKSGILSKLSVDGNFDKSYFTEVDNRNLSEIPVHSKKIQILTTHPSGSYTEVETDGEVAKIKITDKDKFWSLSKFCVILTK